LNAEATAREMTVSSYIESLILSRSLEDNGKTTLLQDLKERLLQLEIENEKLQNQVENDGVHVHADVHAEKMEALMYENKLLRQEKHQLEEAQKQLTIQRDSLAKMSSRATPLWLSDEGNAQMVAWLKKLKVAYPQLTYEQLMVAALDTTYHNTNSFFVHTMKHYLEQNPHLLTSKNLSA
jgi:hypothetical protein